MAKDALQTYRAKRDFTRTGEPMGELAERPTKGRRYLIQKHDATRMHFDFRLEHDGVLLSWAVPNGPSLDPADKRLAVHVEDHPLEYGDFEGTIPNDNYGGGTVMLWDEGTWEPVGDPDLAFDKGDFKFVLHGKRLKGKWVLVRMKSDREKPKRRRRGSPNADNWLLIKERDRYATTEKKPIVERAMTSVRSGRTMEEIAEGNVEWVESTFHFTEDKPAKRSAKSGQAAPPKFVAPQLATSVEAPPRGEDWLHEIKFDGYRAIVAVGGSLVRIFTRTGLDWSDKFAPLLQSFADLPCTSALIDGEVAVADKEGRTDFGALQDAIAEGKEGMIFYAFDLLSRDGKDLRREPLIARKERLAVLLENEPDSGPLFFSDHVVGNGGETFDRACALGLEGIISKRANAPYRSGRTKNWLKAKCGMGQEFVVIGWQPSKVKARPFSSLLVATRDEDKLAYRGRVGSGFAERDLDQLWTELEKRAVKTPPVDDVPVSIRRASKFIKPELVIAVEFSGWTDDGYVRHGVYKGIRTDKAATDIVREVAETGRQGATTKARENRRSDPDPGVTDAPAVVTIDTDKEAGTIAIAGVRVTHPDRVVFAGQKITKRGLIDYYLSIADRILPHVAKRPLSLVRCPSGADGDCFFQKHASPGFPRAFKPIRIKEKRSTDSYLYIEDEKGLVAAVQMGVLELHIWGAHIDTLEQPDRIVFDFDPDEAVDFATVKDSAKEMRDRLKALGLVSFAMATGGKGLHVVVPLTPRHEWVDVKAFAEAMARIMAAENPDRYLAEASKTRRKGRIYIDYLRNGRGATAIAPFSTRARAGAPIAWPVAWNALGRLKSAHEATVENAATLLKRRKDDPWEGYFEVDQVLPLEKLNGS